MPDTAQPETKLPKDLAAEQGLVNVQIDDHWIQVPRGTRIIEACKLAEQEVPHYCYHPKLSSPGNCRMCLVQMGMPPRLAPGQEPSFNDQGYQEIGWMPRPVIACANTVAENMGIRTKGELVETCREGVMEFLLINHPLDCPICDQAGECSLQEYSVEHGKGKSRFFEDKIKKPKNVDIGPRINLDDERCIMCSRCIRFMEEVADEPVLGFIDRGTHTKLTCHPGRKVESNYGMNIIDLCPVGALTSKDFRFQMRVWFLKETKSIDTNCGTGCNTVLWSRGNEIFRVTPRQNDDVNSTWMPDSHRLAFKEIHSDKRLTQVLEKTEGVHLETEWSNAQSVIKKALAAFQPDEIAIIGSARLTNEELYLLNSLAKNLGSSQISLVPRFKKSDEKLISEDRNPNTTGAQLILNTEKPFEHLEEIHKQVRSGKIKALIVWGEDLTEEAGFTEENLNQLDFLVAANTHANPTAKIANIVIPTASFAEKRGSMVNVTGRLQRLNQAIIPSGKAMDDWEALRDLNATLTEEKVSSYMIEDILKQISNEVEAFKGITYSKISDTGMVIHETGVKIPLIEKEKERIENREIVG